MLELIPVFAGVVLAQLAPGPNLMAVSSNAMSSGRRAGLATALAIGLGNGIWAVIFALGVGTLLVTRPAALDVLSLLGGAYLIFLGIRAVIASLKADQTGASAGRERSTAQAFRHGLIINLTNPKAALLWASVTVYLAGLGLSPAQLFLAAGGVVVSALLVYGGYGFVFSTGAIRSGYAKISRWIEGAFGIVFGALGGRLVWDGITGLRQP